MINEEFENHMILFNPDEVYASPSVDYEEIEARRCVKCGYLHEDKVDMFAFRWCKNCLNKELKNVMKSAQSYESRLALAYLILYAKDMEAFDVEYEYKKEVELLFDLDDVINKYMEA